MGQSKSGPPPIVYILAVLLIAGGGYYYYTNQPKTTPSTSTTAPTQAPVAVVPTSPPDVLPSGTMVRIDGSTSLARFNQLVGKAFEAKYPGVQFTGKANGSSKGIKALLAGEVEVAASSRPLKPDEESQGLIATPVKNDAIAILVGRANAFNKGLTTDQLRSVFSGQVNNWSQVGGNPLPLRVINRNTGSGTYQLFKDAILGGGEFGSGPNWTNMTKDVTTEILQKLGTNGVGYANFSEIKSQQTIRALAIDGELPTSPNYPLITTLYYVLGPNASPGALAFVAFATSPEGQAIAKQD